MGLLNNQIYHWMTLVIVLWTRPDPACKSNIKLYPIRTVVAHYISHAGVWCFFTNKSCRLYFVSRTRFSQPGLADKLNSSDISVMNICLDAYGTSE